MASDFLEQVASLVDDQSLPLVSLLSNLSSLIYYSMFDKNKLNWAGFYISNFEQTAMFLGPFQGKLACTRILNGKGVVGTCMESRKPILVGNVDEFEGHIRCDVGSKSEICVPVIVDDTVAFVLDLDSQIVDGFSDQDLELLQDCCKILQLALQERQILDSSSFVRLVGFNQ